MTDQPQPRPPFHRELPPQRELRKLFSYDPLLGGLIWRARHNSQIKADKIAGWVDPRRGYRLVSISNITYKHHRLVWCYFYDDPSHFLVDHINCSPGDDRIENLRLATKSQNKCNSPDSTTSSSGRRGVSFHKATSKWQAKIKIHGRTHHLGCFSQVDEAAKAYELAAIRLHGDFAAIKTQTNHE